MSEYGDESPDVFVEYSRLARKEHQCSACGETIRKGDRYVLARVLYDGRWQHVKRCGRCEKIYCHLSDRMRGNFDGEYCHWTLNCGHTYQERWGEEPPPEIAALAFALPGEVSP